ncbi:MAG: methionyl aminopeptidase [Lachnospiraceae bacterium]|jgi:methionyl aminopeptidase|nr:methionyl aminopeptidase [Lachnospiraceae bacterium]
MVTMNRNDPCWCGSGQKYKKCHYEFDRRLAMYRLKGCKIPSRNLIKTPAQMEKIRESARINVAVLDYVAARIGAGVTTEQVDRWVYEETTRRGGIPAPLNFQGFPKSVCTSLNDQVCHGIPSPDVVLKEGDIVNVDVSTVLDGYYSDSSRMFCIGTVSPEKEKLVKVARECMELGLQAVKPWGFLGDVGQAVNDHARRNGFQVVQNIGGHGVGLAFHEEPFVSYVARRNTGMILAPGLCFTIEPMVNMGTWENQVEEANGWTVHTRDGLPSAQWEIQVLVTETGYEVIAW